MASAVHRGALPTAPAARPRPLRRLLAGSALPFAAAARALPARLAQQLRQLKQFKVGAGDWEGS